MPKLEILKPNSFTTSSLNLFSSKLVVTDKQIEVAAETQAETDAKALWYIYKDPEYKETLKKFSAITLWRMLGAIEVNEEELKSLFELLKTSKTLRNKIFSDKFLESVFATAAVQEQASEIHMPEVSLTSSDASSLSHNLNAVASNTIIKMAAAAKLAECIAFAPSEFYQNIFTQISQNSSEYIDFARFVQAHVGEKDYEKARLVLEAIYKRYKSEPLILRTFVSEILLNSKLPAACLETNLSLVIEENDIDALLGAKLLIDLFICVDKVDQAFIGRAQNNPNNLFKITLPFASKVINRILNDNQVDVLQRLNVFQLAGFLQASNFDDAENKSAAINAVYQKINKTINNCNLREIESYSKIVDAISQAFANSVFKNAVDQQIAAILLQNPFVLMSLANYSPENLIKLYKLCTPEQQKLFVQTFAKFADVYADYQLLWSATQVAEFVGLMAANFLRASSNDTEAARQSFQNFIYSLGEDKRNEFALWIKSKVKEIGEVRINEKDKRLLISMLDNPLILGVIKFSEREIIMLLRGLEFNDLKVETYQVIATKYSQQISSIIEGNHQQLVEKTKKLIISTKDQQDENKIESLLKFMQVSKFIKFKVISTQQKEALKKELLNELKKIGVASLRIESIVRSFSTEIDDYFEETTNQNNFSNGINLIMSTINALRDKRGGLREGLASIRETVTSTFMGEDAEEAIFKIIFEIVEVSPEILDDNQATSLLKELGFITEKEKKEQQQVLAAVPSTTAIREEERRPIKLISTEPQKNPETKPAEKGSELREYRQELAAIIRLLREEYRVKRVSPYVYAVSATGSQQSDLISKVQEVAFANDTGFNTLFKREEGVSGLSKDHSEKLEERLSAEKDFGKVLNFLTRMEKLSDHAKRAIQIGLLKGQSVNIENFKLLAQRANSFTHDFNKQLTEVIKDIFNLPLSGITGEDILDLCVSNLDSNLFKFALKNWEVKQAILNKFAVEGGVEKSEDETSKKIAELVGKLLDLKKDTENYKNSKRDIKRQIAQLRPQSVVTSLPSAASQELMGGTGIANLVAAANSQLQRIRSDIEQRLQPELKKQLETIAMGIKESHLNPNKRAIEVPKDLQRFADGIRAILEKKRPKSSGQKQNVESSLPQTTKIEIDTYILQVLKAKEAEIFEQKTNAIYPIVLIILEVEKSEIEHKRARIKQIDNLSAEEWDKIKKNAQLFKGLIDLYKEYATECGMVVERSEIIKNAYKHILVSDDLPIEYVAPKEFKYFLQTLPEIEAQQVQEESILVKKLNKLVELTLPGKFKQNIEGIQNWAIDLFDNNGNFLIPKLTLQQFKVIVGERVDFIPQVLKGNNLEQKKINIIKNNKFLESDAFDLFVLQPSGFNYFLKTLPDFDASLVTKDSLAVAKLKRLISFTNPQMHIEGSVDIESKNKDENMVYRDTVKNWAIDLFDDNGDFVIPNLSVEQYQILFGNDIGFIVQLLKADATEQKKINILKNNHEYFSNLLWAQIDMVETEDYPLVLEFVAKAGILQENEEKNVRQKRFFYARLQKVLNDENVVLMTAKNLLPESVIKILEKALQEKIYFKKEGDKNRHDPKYKVSSDPAAWRYLLLTRILRKAGLLTESQQSFVYLLLAMTVEKFLVQTHAEDLHKLLTVGGEAVAKLLIENILRNKNLIFKLEGHQLTDYEKEVMLTFYGYGKETVAMVATAILEAFEYTHISAADEEALAKERLFRGMKDNLIKKLMTLSGEDSTAKLEIEKAQLLAEQSEEKEKEEDEEGSLHLPNDATPEEKLSDKKRLVLLLQQKNAIEIIIDNSGVVEDIENIMGSRSGSGFNEYVKNNSRRLSINYNNYEKKVITNKQFNAYAKNPHIIKAYLEFVILERKNITIVVKLLKLAADILGVSLRLYNKVAKTGLYEKYPGVHFSTSLEGTIAIGIDESGELVNLGGDFDEKKQHASTSTITSSASASTSSVSTEVVPSAIASEDLQTDLSTPIITTSSSFPAEGSSIVPQSSLSVPSPLATVSVAANPPSACTGSTSINAELSAVSATSEKPEELIKKAEQAQSERRKRWHEKKVQSEDAEKQIQKNAASSSAINTLEEPLSSVPPKAPPPPPVTHTASSSSARGDSSSIASAASKVVPTPPPAPPILPLPEVSGAPSGVKFEYKEEKQKEVEGDLLRENSEKDDMFANLEQELETQQGQHTAGDVKVDLMSTLKAKLVTIKGRVDEGDKAITQETQRVIKRPNIANLLKGMDAKRSAAIEDLKILQAEKDKVAPHLERTLRLLQAQIDVVMTYLDDFNKMEEQQKNFQKQSKELSEEDSSRILTKEEKQSLEDAKRKISSMYSVLFIKKAQILDLDKVTLDLANDAAQKFRDAMESLKSKDVEASGPNSSEPPVTSNEVLNLKKLAWETKQKRWEFLIEFFKSLSSKDIEKRNEVRDKLNMLATEMQLLGKIIYENPNFCFPGETRVKDRNAFLEEKSFYTVEAAQRTVGPKEMIKQPTMPTLSHSKSLGSLAGPAAVAGMFKTEGSSPPKSPPSKTYTME